jgi:hypothetical protein
MIAEEALIRNASFAIFLKRLVQSLGENLDILVCDVELDSIAVELDLVNPPFALGQPLDRRGERRFDESRKRRLDADRLGLCPL